MAIHQTLQYVNGNTSDGKNIFINMGKGLFNSTRVQFSATMLTSTQVFAHNAGNDISDTQIFKRFLGSRPPYGILRLRRSRIRLQRSESKKSTSVLPTAHIKIFYASAKVVFFIIQLCFQLLVHVL